MKTIGGLLKKRRDELGLSLESAETDLRIRKKYLQSLEEDNFDVFPSVNYVKGFLRNYCRFLGLDEEKVLAIFRRQFNFEERRRIIPPGISKPLDGSWFKITPQRAAVAAAFIIVAILFFYLGSQIWF